MYANTQKWLKILELEKPPNGNSLITKYEYNNRLSSLPLWLCEFRK